MLPLQQLIDLGLAGDRDSLQRRLERAAADLGFGRFSAVLIRGSLGSQNAWLAGIGNTPAEYSAAMNSLQDALRDPVLTALRSSIAPVQYDQALYVGAGAADLWDLQAPYGYRAGVACTVHETSHLEQFMFGVDGDALPHEQTGRIALTAAVQLLTVYAQSAMQRIFTPAPSGSPVLADDELEPLRWAKDAYTVHQIGDKLSISSVHVEHKLRQTARKLGVSSVPAAVLRCIEGGLID
jgi:DNA-binding CsgD family transcriptional regulator